MVDEQIKATLASAQELLETLERLNDKANEGLELYASLAEMLINGKLPAKQTVIIIFKALVEIHVRNSKRIIDFAKDLQKLLEKNLDPDGNPTPPPASGMKN